MEDNKILIFGNEYTMIRRITKNNRNYIQSTFSKLGADDEFIKDFSMLVNEHQNQTSIPINLAVLRMEYNNLMKNIALSYNSEYVGVNLELAILSVHMCVATIVIEDYASKHFPDDTQELNRMLFNAFNDVVNNHVKATLIKIMKNRCTLYALPHSRYIDYLYRELVTRSIFLINDIVNLKPFDFCTSRVKLYLSQRRVLEIASNSSN